MLLSGLPPLVREGDRYAATFTVRNASKRRMTVRATAKSTRTPPRSRSSARPPRSRRKMARADLKSLTVELPAGGARDVAWPVTAPVGVDALALDGGRARDRRRCARRAAHVAARERAVSGAHLPGDADAARRPVFAAGRAAGRSGAGTRRRRRRAAAEPRSGRCRACASTCPCTRTAASSSASRGRSRCATSRPGTRRWHACPSTSMATACCGTSRGDARRAATC